MSDARVRNQRNPASSEFDRATGVRPRPGEPSRYDVDLSPDWTIGEALNGGYLLAVMGRALGEALPHPDPFSITAHYLTAALPGPARIDTARLRAGRAHSTGTAALVQVDAEGREVERVRVLATHGRLDDLGGEVLTSAKPPVLPPPERCFGPEDNPDPNAVNPPVTERFQMRLDPATCGWAVGEPGGVGEMRAWLSLADGRQPDPLSLLLAVDALPPTAFELGVKGWVPTVELTAHLRARPAPGPLRVAISTRNLARGYLEEDAEVWDSEDQLVAQSRQLARLPHQR
ncbi:thioesterase family protein [Streptomyces sp. NPDC005438]|uniref:thioesterase family protein n=1 Tax=Streptomyces sp. NPDC005438 TaxID=3156880 RepID=UPI0033BC19B2